MDATIYGAGLASYPAGVHLHVGLYHSNLRAAITLTVRTTACRMARSR